MVQYIFLNGIMVIFLFYLVKIMISYYVGKPINLEFVIVRKDNTRIPVYEPVTKQTFERHFPKEEKNLNVFLHRSEAERVAGQDKVYSEEHDGAIYSIAPVFAIRSELFDLENKENKYSIPNEEIKILFAFLPPVAAYPGQIISFSHDLALPYQQVLLGLPEDVSPQILIATLNKLLDRVPSYNSSGLRQSLSSFEFKDDLRLGREIFGLYTKEKSTLSSEMVEYGVMLSVVLDYFSQFKYFKDREILARIRQVFDGVLSRDLQGVVVDYLIPKPL